MRTKKIHYFKVRSELFNGEIALRVSLCVIHLKDNEKQFAVFPACLSSKRETRKAFAKCFGTYSENPSSLRLHGGCNAERFYATLQG